MTLASNPPAVVVDASACVAFSSDEPINGALVTAALQDYAANGWIFHAPNILVAAGLFALCRKHAAGLLNDAEHARAITDFLALMSNVRCTEGGDVQLAARAEELRTGYGCSRSADGLYLALAERLATAGQVELLTLDRGMAAQAVGCSPSIVVRVLSVP
jgi:predicted nucleic acid-binding protein